MANGFGTMKPVPQNIVTAVDPKTGRKTINQAAIPQIGKTTMNCPADPGGRGWPATAYSPITQTLYLPLNEFCANATVRALAARAVGGARPAAFPLSCRLVHRYLTAMWAGWMRSN